jgi:hypothetical protein
MEDLGFAWVSATVQKILEIEALRSVDWRRLLLLRSAIVEGDCSL